MKRYTVNVVMTISGSIEVEADTEDEAAETAANADYDEWDEVCVDNTETHDVECLSDVCDVCDEDDEDCTCEYCETCDRLVDDCECEYDDQDEDDEEEEDE